MARTRAASACDVVSTSEKRGSQARSSSREARWNTRWAVAVGPVEIVAGAGERGVRAGRDGAFLVRALPGTGVAGLHAHGARSAQRGERASRALRRSGRPRHRNCPPRVPTRLAGTGTRLAAALFAGAHHLAGGRRSRPRNGTPSQGRGLSERAAADAAAGGRR